MSETMQVTICRKYRYRIYPTPDQEEFMRKCCGAARYVYNRFVDMGEEDMKAGRKVKKHGYPELFTDAPWLKEMDSCALDSAKRDYNSALKRWREDPRMGKPKRKTKRNARKSYRTNNQKNSNTIWVRKNWLKLPKMKRPVKMIKHRYLPEGCRITSATIIEETRGEWYASITVEYDINLPKELVVPLDRICALDYSSPLFYVDNNGNSPDVVKQYRTDEDKIVYLQSKKDKREYSSNNWWDAHNAVNKEHMEVARKRKDFTEKESARMAKAHDIVIVEDLNLQNLAQSLNFGKATNDNGFGMFRTQLMSKLSEKAGALVKLPRFFPSSKVCSKCGNKNDQLGLGIEEWDCPSCSEHLYRDWNAACNLFSCGVFGLVRDGYVSKIVLDTGEVVGVWDVVSGDIELLRMVENRVLSDGRKVVAIVFDTVEAFMVDEEIEFSPVIISEDSMMVWLEAKKSLVD